MCSHPTGEVWAKRSSGTILPSERRCATALFDPELAFPDTDGNVECGSKKQTMRRRLDGLFRESSHRR